MSFPFFSCSVCSAYVQLKWGEGEKHHMPTLNYRLRGQLAVNITSELESDDFVNNCRGQGSKYSDRSGSSVALQQGKETHHYNFQGMFQGMCCFCAVRIGLSSLSFVDISCYHCKQRDMLYQEFSRLRVAQGAVAPCWESHGWGALSDTLIDYIIALALNNRVGKGGQVDRMLLDC
jgi:hypothetical protein